MIRGSLFTIRSEARLLLAKIREIPRVDVYSYADHCAGDGEASQSSTPGRNLVRVERAKEAQGGAFCSGQRENPSQYSSFRDSRLSCNFLFVYVPGRRSIPSPSHAVLFLKILHNVSRAVFVRPENKSFEEGCCVRTNPSLNVIFSTRRLAGRITSCGVTLTKESFS